MAYIRSQGTVIYKLDTSVSPNAYAAIGQVTSISGPDGNVPEVDVTHLSSTGKEYIGGLADFGSVTMDLIWDPATVGTLHEAIWDDFLAATVSTYQIRLSDSPQTTITFSAYPSQYSLNLGVDEAVRASLGLRVTGAPTLNTP